MCSVLTINGATGPEGVVGAVEEMSLPVADNEAPPLLTMEQALSS